MGTYLYEQTTKQVTINLIGSPAIVANEIKYYTKPDWDLWNDCAYFASSYDKKIIAAYKRKRTVCEKRIPNQYVVDHGYDFYKWEDGTEQVLFSDDDNFGRNLILIGVIHKVGKQWCIF